MPKQEPPLPNPHHRHKRPIHIPHQNQTNPILFQRDGLQVIEGHFPRDFEVVGADEEDAGGGEHDDGVVAGEVCREGGERCE